MGATLQARRPRGRRASIAIAPWNARQGGPTVLLAASGAVHYYPSFSADDALVAFDKVDSGSTYFNANAEIHVVPASGAATPHRVVANDPPTRLGTTSPGVTNSWPRWSPEVKEEGGRKYCFLTFSSKRLASGPVSQIYVAPVVVEGTTIMSYPALYSWSQAEAVEKPHAFVDRAVLATGRGRVSGSSAGRGQRCAR